MKIKNSKWTKFLLGWMLGGLFVGFSLASSGTVTLSAQLANNKDDLLVQIETAKTSLNSEYQRVLGPEIQTANYQSLLCLGAIKNESLSDDMQEEFELLRTTLLQDYVSINAKIFNLLNQYSVGLIDDNSYLTQYNKLSLDVQSYYDNNQNMITQTQNNYLQKIFNTIEDSKTYIQNNAELLTTLNDKISKIQETVRQFKILEEGVFEINNALNLHQGTFFDTIQNTKISTVHMLQDALNQQIQRYNWKYSNKPELKHSYEQKRDNIVQDFDKKLDAIIHDSIGSWYDIEQYEKLKTQIDIIKNKFYEQSADGDKLNCSKVIATDLDLDGYINDVELETKALRNDVSKGVLILNTVESGVNMRQEILNSLKNKYISQYNEAITSFKKFIKSYTSIPTSSMVQSTENTTDTVLGELKKISFDRPFEKGEINDTVKQLQILLNKLGYYHGQIFGKYDVSTIDAVYQFQLAKGILKGIPGEKAQGYMGPSTRKALNQEISQYFSQKTIDNDTYQERDISHINILASSNPFIPLIQQLADKYTDKSVFIASMQNALPKISSRMNTSVSLTQQKTLKKIIEAIQDYLANIS